MSRMWSMPVRVFAGFVVILALFGAQAAAAQSAIGPNDDFDGDGLPNKLDADDDNDGVTDENDAYPFDATRWQREVAATSPPPTATSPPPAPTSPPPAATAPAPTAPPPLPTAPTVPMPTIPAPSPGQGADVHEEPRGNSGGGAGPAPSVIDSDADSDGDGISNSHDPDDDNDGVADDKDCAPFNPSVTVCSDLDPTPPPTMGASEPTQPTQPTTSRLGERGGGMEAGMEMGMRSAGSLGLLYVTSLPVTGDGPESGDTAMLWLLGGLAGACAGSAMLLRQRVR